MKLLQRILVTNDDGIAAPGLRVAEAIAAELAAEVWVVAPEHDQSGVGQSISLHSPLRCHADGKRRYALSGTPADCVMYALAQWFADAPPDLVLSGVNCGANLGDAVMYSGTVGAVLAAAHMGVPAIALSQAFHDRKRVDFAGSKRLSAALVRELLRWQPQPDGWNVNFPDCPVAEIGGFRITRQATGGMVRPKLKNGTDGRGLDYHWLMFERGAAVADVVGSDVAALREGSVSVMPLRMARCDDEHAGKQGQACRLPLPGMTAASGASAQDGSNTGTGDKLADESGLG